MLATVLAVVALLFAACKLRSSAPRVWRIILIVTAVLDIMVETSILTGCG